MPKQDRTVEEHNAKMKKNSTKLEDVHTVILIGERLRWLDIEELEGDQGVLIRGIFSTSQIGRQMDIPITPSEKAQTFMELETAIAH